MRRFEFNFGGYITDIHTRRRLSSRELNLKYPKAISGDFVINNVGIKRYKIIKSTHDWWNFYEIKENRG